jgi:hypothetical protein
MSGRNNKLKGGAVMKKIALFLIVFFVAWSVPGSAGADFNVTTTGAAATVTLSDLGGRVLTHPVTVDLEAEYEISALMISLNSGDIKAARDAGNIRVTIDRSADIIPDIRDGRTLRYLPGNPDMTGQSYNTVQECIDYAKANTPGAGSPWVVKISTNTADDFEMSEYVNIYCESGAGASKPELSGTITRDATTGDCTIHGATVKDLGVTGTRPLILNECNVDLSAVAVGGDIQIYDSTVTGDLSDATTVYLFRCEAVLSSTVAGCSYYFYDSNVTGDIGDATYSMFEHCGTVTGLDLPGSIDAIYTVFNSCTMNGGQYEHCTISTPAALNAGTYILLNCLFYPNGGNAYTISNAVVMEMRSGSLKASTLTLNNAGASLTVDGITQIGAITITAGTFLNVGDFLDYRNFNKRLSASNKQVQSAIDTLDDFPFGLEFQQAASEGLSQHTGNTNYQEKLKLTTASIPAGTYRIGWACDWYSDSTDGNKAFKMRVQVDDSVTAIEWNAVNSMADKGESPAAGFGYVTLTAAAHTIDIDYGVEDAGKTAYIKNARLEIWRVQ